MNNLCDVLIQYFVRSIDVYDIVLFDLPFWIEMKHLLWIFEVLICIDCFSFKMSSILLENSIRISPLNNQNQDSDTFLDNNTPRMLIKWIMIHLKQSSYHLTYQWTDRLQCHRNDWYWWDKWIFWVIFRWWNWILTWSIVKIGIACQRECTVTILIYSLEISLYWS
jgi:hypothetical protein